MRRNIQDGGHYSEFVIVAFSSSSQQPAKHMPILFLLLCTATDKARHPLDLLAGVIIGDVETVWMVDLWVG